MRIEFDGIVGLGELEGAAMAFAREAPAQLVADAIESMIADLVDAVVGPSGCRCSTTSNWRHRGPAPGAGAGAGSAAEGSGRSRER
ncbi:MAG: hypothetical protein ACRD0Q_02970 [Acidimicrobiales bacterium]